MNVKTSKAMIIKWADMRSAMLPDSSWTEGSDGWVEFSIREFTFRILADEDRLYVDGGKGVQWTVVLPSNPQDIWGVLESVIDPNSLDNL